MSSSRRDRSSSTASQSSMSAIYPGIPHSPLLAEPAEGRTNVYGSFTTTAPAALYLSLRIPFPGRPSLDDTPPDSPLSFFQSIPGSRRSPSITRTLTDVDWSVPPSPSSPQKIHPVLAAVETVSKLSRTTVCTTCTKAGTNFPKCPRCDATWCSRACRLQGGSKHLCAPRDM